MPWNSVELLHGKLELHLTATEYAQVAPCRKAREVEVAMSLCCKQDKTAGKIDKYGAQEKWGKAH